MTDHIPDAAKMIHDTPRTYRAYRQSLYSLFMESRLLEKEVNTYKVHVEMQEKRIKQLEDIIKRASIRFFQDGSDGKTATDMLAILDEAMK